VNATSDEKRQLFLGEFGIGHDFLFPRSLPLAAIVHFDTPGYMPVIHHDDVLARQEMYTSLLKNAGVSAREGFT
jgi:hypothetical protein